MQKHMTSFFANAYPGTFRNMNQWKGSLGWVQNAACIVIMVSLKLMCYNTHLETCSRSRMLCKMAGQPASQVAWSGMPAIALPEATGFGGHPGRPPGRHPGRPTRRLPGGLAGGPPWPAAGGGHAHNLLLTAPADDEAEVLKCTTLIFVQNQWFFVQNHRFFNICISTQTMRRRVCVSTPLVTASGGAAGCIQRPSPGMPGPIQGGLRGATGTVSGTAPREAAGECWWQACSAGCRLTMTNFIDFLASLEIF